MADLQDDFEQPLSIKQYVYNFLRKKIILGDLKPGSRLREAELSESLQISRAPIREALNMLEKDGFAQILPRRGAIVSEITADRIFSIWETRLLLEPYIARSTLPFLTDEEIEKTEAAMRRAEGRAADVEADMAVHELLSSHLENDYMKQLLDNLKAHSQRIRWFNNFKHPADGAEEAAQTLNNKREHWDILLAVKSRDEEKTFQAVQFHMVQSAYRVLRSCGIALTDRQAMSLRRFEGGGPAR